MIIRIWQEISDFFVSNFFVYQTGIMNNNNVFIHYDLIIHLFFTFLILFTQSITIHKTPDVTFHRAHAGLTPLSACATLARSVRNRLRLVKSRAEISPVPLCVSAILTNP